MIHADLRKEKPVLWMAVVALFMAMNIALCTVAVPVPGGHFYLNDVVIVTASLLLDPLGAFLVGGVGAFLGDLFFYPLPMFVSLVSHGLQAILISYCFRKSNGDVRGAITGILLGGITMVTGYTLGKIFIYSTLEYAIVKLPYEILQACVGGIAGYIICFPARLRKQFDRIVLRAER